MQHGTRAGSPLVLAVERAGIGWHLARVWIGGGRTLERRLKNYHKSAQLCPVCNPRILVISPAVLLEEEDTSLGLLDDIAGVSQECPF